MDLRRLDALVAEHVMGWVRVQPPKWDYNGPLPEQGEVLAPPELLLGAIRSGEYVWPPVGVIPFTYFVTQRYSSDISSAWQVVELMMRLGWEPHIDYDIHHKRWEVYFGHMAYDAGYASADTAPLAICLAALKALGVEVPEQ